MLKTYLTHVEHMFYIKKNHIKHNLQLIVTYRYVFQRRGKNRKYTMTLLNICASYTVFNIY